MAHVTPGGLGRRVPTDFKHIEKYPIRQLALPQPITVNKTLTLPRWHWNHDQGSEGACVGFGTTMMMAILNESQRRANKTRPYAVRYDPWWLWDRAKEIDEWPETHPGDGNGTSVRAACDVARDAGLVRYRYTSKLLAHILGNPTLPNLDEGISTYRWATDVDQMRACIAAGIPISIGVNWYSSFDTPQRVSGEWWIGRGHLGSLRGGHCVCIYGASDKRQAFRVKNSWGKNYPLIWLPYVTMARLLLEQGEACIVTDR
jgi:hypothetical protein